MAYATQQTGFRTSVQSSRTAPFRAGPAPPRRRAAVVTQASQDPVGDVAKKALAAVAAASIALCPLAANAGPLDSVLNQAGAAKDKAAGATGGDNPIGNFIDQAKAGADRGIKTAPSIGEAVENAAGNVNSDAKRVAGSARQGAKDVQNQPSVGFSGSADGLQVNVGLPSPGGVADKAKGLADKAAGAAKDATGSGAGPLQGAAGDAKKAVGDLKQGGKDISTKPVGFSGAQGLQVNVGLPSPSGVADKAKGLADKATGAAKDATGSGAGPLQGAAGDAKNALGDLKQGGKDISTKPVGFSGRADGLQVNVGGLPDLSGAADKAKGLADKATGAAKDATGSGAGPLQGAAGDAKNALGDLKQGGKDISTKPVGFTRGASGLQVNVSGSPNVADKAKGAADKAAGGGKDAALQGPANKLLQQGGKDASAKPAGFSGDARGLQVNVDAAYGGGGDKPASATDKSTGAAKDLSDQTAGPLTDASGDAKTVDAAKEGIKKLKNQPMVGFNARTDGLQINVGFGGLQDKASDAAKQAGNKVQGEAKGAGGGSGPTLGGIADKAKQAIGSATSGGNSDIATKPVSFSGAAASLQSNVDFPVKLQDKAKASNETQKRANDSKSDGQQRAGADALGGVISKGADAVKKQTGTAFNGAAGLQKNVDFPVKLQDKAKASNETQKRANDSKSDGMQRSGADALGGVINKGADVVKKQTGTAFTGAAGLQKNVDFPVKLQDKAKASNETQKRANDSKSDGQQRAGADALGGVISKGADVVKKQTGTAFTGAAGLQKNVDFPVKLQDKAKASNETQQRANDSKSDGMSRPGADALGDIISKGADAINVGGLPGLPSLGGAADQAKGAADKAAGAAKDVSGSGAGPLQGAAGDAKNALGQLKQGGGDISTKPVSLSAASAPASFNPFSQALEA